MSNEEPMSILVADFGEAFITRSLPQTAGGTFPYMAPERIELKITTRKSDLWSCGIIIYEMIYLKWPFKDDKEMMRTKKRLEFDTTINITKVMKPLLVE